MGFVNSRLHNNIFGAVTVVLAPAVHRQSGVSCQNDVTQMIAVTRATTRHCGARDPFLDATTVPNRSRPERTSGFAHVFFKF